MRYFFAKEAVLRYLESPSVYHIKRDDLYELDCESFTFFKKCISKRGCNAESNSFIEYCLSESILTTETVSQKHPFIKKSPVPSLRYLELQITDCCNLRCRHCYIDSPESCGKKPLELNTSQIRTVLTEFEEMQGLRVLITGGEPLMHSRFEDINEMLPDFRLRKVLFTNGLLLTQKRLKNLNVNEIQISIDGLETANDSLRGKGTFKKTMDALVRALRNGFEVSVSTMIHSGNLDDFPDMERLFKKIGIKEWTVDVPCVTGNLMKNPAFRVLPEKSGKYLKYGYAGGVHSDTSTQSEKGFGCGLHLMSVMSDGRTAKCTFYSDKPSGTIKKGLRKSWSKIKPVRLDKLLCDCEYLESCRGGCRYRAELIGNPLGKDTYRCSLYEQKKNLPE